MNRTILPGARTGEVQIPASKSQAHRLLLCAALGEQKILLRCRGRSEDIMATVDCLSALGASIETDGECISLRPIEKAVADRCLLPCRESGSTLRFLLPLIGALGIQASFLREGRLPERPVEPLCSELRRNGMDICEDGALLRCGGQLHSGAFSLPGNISSQFISALLMTLPLLSGESTLHIDGEIESAPYIAMTEEILQLGGICYEKTGRDYRIAGQQRYRFPSEHAVEGDYSGAAFFLCAGALSEGGIRVNGLNPRSRQGDKEILSLLEKMGAQISRDGDSVIVHRGALRGITVDASSVPDLIPALSVVAAAASGETRIVRAQRLRFKESDRLHSTAQMLRSLGAHVDELPDGLTIYGSETLSGGTVDTFGDHRIAMSCAIAGCVCRHAVTVRGSECVRKSYPDFWKDFTQLKGDPL